MCARVLGGRGRRIETSRREWEGGRGLGGTKVELAPKTGNASLSRSSVEAIF